MPASLAATSRPTSPGVGQAPTPYEPGVCNIGPAEIARRRRAGHVGTVVTLVVLGVLVVIDAPPLARFVLALPAAAAASGYLQAWLHFCAGFGSRGIFNFGALGQTREVKDPTARARDRARARQIGAASLGIGVGVALAAVRLGALAAVLLGALAR
jgi:hypothetical protein